MFRERRDASTFYKSPLFEQKVFDLMFSRHNLLTLQSDLLESSCNQFTGNYPDCCRAILTRL